MIRSKRLLAVGLVATLGLAAAACGGDDDDDDTATTEAPSASAETTPEGTTAEGTTPEGTTPEGTTAEGTTPEGTAAPAVEAPAVGLLFDITGRGDRSFNDAAAAGLDAAKASVAATGTESTPTSDGDRAERLDGLLAQDLDLIIGVGFLWQPDAPGGCGRHARPAVRPHRRRRRGRPGHAGRLRRRRPTAERRLDDVRRGAGLVPRRRGRRARRASPAPIGFVGGVETDLIKKFEAGFVAGAKAVNPDIEVLSQYITQPPDFTGFNDPAKGKEIAASMYSEGADVVYAAAGGSGLGVIQAASEAGEAGTVWAIGVDSDQYQLVDAALQPYVLTSMLKKVDVAVQQTIDKLANGEFRGGPQVFDLAAGGVDYSTSGGFVDDISAELDDYKQQIIDGEIEVPTAP